MTQKEKVYSIIGKILGMIPAVWWGVEAVKTKSICVSTFGGNKAFTAVILLVCMAVCIYLQAIVHETGHLLAGILNDFRFVSFRIGNRMLIRDHGRLTIRTMKVKGTGGQCLMCPPDSETGDIDDVWYLLGGGLANLVLASIGMYLYGAVKVSGWSYAIFFQEAIAGLMFAIWNLFPMKTVDIANDGYNVFFSNQDRVSKRALYYLLTVNARLSKTDQIAEFGDDLYQKVAEFPYADLTNPYQGNLYYLLIILHMSQGSYELAKQCAQRLAAQDGVLQLFQNEAKQYLLYDELTDACRKEEVDRLYQATAQYRKSMDWNPYTGLVEYAYELLYHEDEARALSVLVNTKKRIEKSAVGMEKTMILHEIDRTAQISKKHMQEAGILPETE